LSVPAAFPCLRQSLRKGRTFSFLRLKEAGHVPSSLRATGPVRPGIRRSRPRLPLRKSRLRRRPGSKGKRNQSAIVLIIPQGGWLLSKHSTMCKIFFDPRNEISMPNNPHYHSSKVSLVSPLGRNNFQSHFQGKSFWVFAVALRLFQPLDGVFSVALQKRRATAVKVKRRHLVAEM
jgi:hypothetical protein